MHIYLVNILDLGIARKRTVLIVKSPTLKIEVNLHVDKEIS